MYAGKLVAVEMTILQMNMDEVGNYCCTVLSEQRHPESCTSNSFENNKALPAAATNLHKIETSTKTVQAKVLLRYYFFSRGLGCIVLHYPGKLLGLLPQVSSVTIHNAQ